jgi:tetratricopeptide (TPR) repeat protein
MSMATHFERAEILMNQHRYDPAVEEFRLALAEDPEDPWVHGYLAWCLERQQQYTEALTAVETAIGLAPDEDRFYYYHARIRCCLAQLDLAKQAIDQALALNPNDVDYYWCLANIQYDQRDYRQALITIERGLAIDAEDQPCQETRLLTLYELKLTYQNDADIKVEAEHLLANYPNSHIAHTVIAWFDLQQGKVKIAEEHFRTALSLSPNSDSGIKGLKQAIKSRLPFYRFLKQLGPWILDLQVKAYTKLYARFPKLWWISHIIYMLLCVPLICKNIIVECGEIVATFICSFDQDFRTLLTPSELRSNRSSVLILIGMLGGVLPAVIYWQIAWLIIPSGHL